VADGDRPQHTEPLAGVVRPQQARQLAPAALRRRLEQRRLDDGRLASNRYRSIFSVRMLSLTPNQRCKSRLLNAAHREVSDGEVLGPTEALPPDSTGASEVPRPSEAMSPETNGVKAGH